MTRLADYESKYPNVRFDRDTDGVLLMTFHTDGGPLTWSEQSHRMLPEAFRDVGGDPDNRVVVMTGTGDEFLVEMDFETRASSPTDWEKICFEGKRMLFDLLDIPVPVVGAVNGPVTEHAEVVLLSDIVIASETATFQDREHFPVGVVPGDGVHVVWPLLLGPNRGRHFLLTGRTLSATEALDLGVVAEVVPRDQLVPHALAIAAELATKPTLTLRYTRSCITMKLKHELQAWMGHGLALESLAAVDRRSFGTAVAS
jgi:enoyl-CoA hydratase/carnithine racemase